MKAVKKAVNEEQVQRDRLARMILDYDAARRVEREAGNTKQEIGREINALMKAMGLGEFDGEDGWRSRIKFIERSTIDKEVLLREGVSMLVIKKATKVTVSEQLDIRQSTGRGGEGDSED